MCHTSRGINPVTINFLYIVIPMFQNVDSGIATDVSYASRSTLIWLNLILIGTCNSLREYAEHTHEKLKPVTILNCILELFNLMIIKFKLTNGSPIHIFCTEESNKSSCNYLPTTERHKQRNEHKKEVHILPNFMSIWLSISSFPPKTSPRPPHLWAALSDGRQNGRL